MRKRFEQQTSLNFVPIADLQLNIKNRDAASKIGFGLLALYKEPTFNEALFEILERYLTQGKQKTGRPGMDLWQIFVMAQYRLGLNLSYDRLHYMCLYDTVLRTLLGIESSQFNSERFEFEYQTILDNVSLLSDELLKEINNLVVDFGHGVFKKKETESSSLKTDSFVVESNVHFPTDYNILWDSLRKCLDMVAKIVTKYPQITGWRKMGFWRKTFKNGSRQIGQVSGRGGKNKEENLQKEVLSYTEKATEFLVKLTASIPDFPMETQADLSNRIALETYTGFALKFKDLLERRVLKGELIQHEEKVFSIFETYTEWVNKGKRNPSVELGKKLAITTDEFNLIIDYRIMEKQTDSELVLDIAFDVLRNHKVKSWSFDKGYWHPINKELLQESVELVVMPKKGKCTKAENEEEHRPAFKKLRNKHSAVESNINELEHRGLNRCPDKGYAHFKRYIGLGICAYNLHKIGARIREEELEKARKHQRAA